MKIAILADPLDNQSAGVHSYTRQLVDALLSFDHDHEIILIREKRDPAQTGVRQIIVPNTRLPIGFASFRLFFLIPLILIRHRVDVVIEPAHFGPWNLPRSVTRVTVIHDLTPILFPQYHRWHSQLLQRIFLKGILRRTDLILSNSGHTTGDLYRMFPFTHGKVETLPLGRDQFFSPTTDRSCLNVRRMDRLYFLFVGTLEPRKGLATLLEAYRIFRSQTRRIIQLVIIGGRGWKLADLEQQIEDHPNKYDILWEGFVSKECLRQWYSHSRALIYPSEYEGFGLPVLEGLACGTNVICTDSSSLPEVGGDLAYYFPVGDTAALAAQMHVVDRQGAEVLDRRREGPAYADRFSWEEYVIRLLAILSEKRS